MRQNAWTRSIISTTDETAVFHLRAFHIKKAYRFLAAFASQHAFDFLALEDFPA
jgi:hypothetical protein